MKKPRIEARHESSGYTSYVVGFVLSIVATLISYFFVKHHLWSNEVLMYFVMAVAVVQLVIQSVFFLHIGRGGRWKILTFVFAILIVLIVVVGSLWIMHNLDYNMMHMSPDQMMQYMHQNEGI